MTPFILFDMFTLNRFSDKLHLNTATEDVKNKNRQNWASAQQKLFQRVQKCLEKLEKGESSSGRKEDVLRTRMYLYIFYMYVEIFCALTLYERVHYASTVVNFLQILIS